MADSTGTDPRFDAAYQRGYRGPAPEVRSREEEAYRRPRRESGRPSRVVVEAAAPSRAGEPARSESASIALDSVAGAESEQESTEERAEARSADVPTAVRPLGRRVPLTLALAGLVLTPLGGAAVWWSTLAAYTTSTVYERLEYQQYLRLLTQFGATPLLTVGLASLAAAVVVQAVRRSRA